MTAAGRTRPPRLTVDGRGHTATGHARNPFHGGHRAPPNTNARLPTHHQARVERSARGFAFPFDGGADRSGHVIRGDSLDVLRCLDPGSIGAVLTDPPFSCYPPPRPTMPATGRRPEHEVPVERAPPPACGLRWRLRDQRSFSGLVEPVMGRARLALRPGALIGAFQDWRSCRSLRMRSRSAASSGEVRAVGQDGGRPAPARALPEPGRVHGVGFERAPARVRRIAPGAYRFSVAAAEAAHGGQAGGPVGGAAGHHGRAGARPVHGPHRRSARPAPTSACRTSGSRRIPTTSRSPAGGSWSTLVGAHRGIA